MAELEMENEKAGDMGISPLLVDVGSRLLLDNVSKGIAIIQDGMIDNRQDRILELCCSWF